MLGALMCVEKQMFILANDIFGFLDFEFQESPQNVHLKCWQDTIREPLKSTKT